MSNIIKRENIFNKTEAFHPKRNGFDLTNKRLSDWDLGVLYPFNVLEMYPNDYIKTMVQTKMNLETLYRPIYDNIKVKFKFFDVAYRNLWKHWRNYYTGGRNGDFKAQEPKVNINCPANVTGSLFDHLGFPLFSQIQSNSTDTTNTSPIYVSAFPFIAYDFIYFWNFINSELQENLVYNIQDGIATNLINSDLFSDELSFFLYYLKDFYLMEDGIPVYTRMLSPNLYSSSRLSLTYRIDDLGLSSRYSYLPSFTEGAGYSNYTPDYQLGLVCADPVEAKTGNIKNRYLLMYPEAGVNITLGSCSLVPSADSPISSNLIGVPKSSTFLNTGFLYNVNWQRDYYTSAHKSTALGGQSSISLTGSANYTFSSGAPATGVAGFDSGSLKSTGSAGLISTNLLINSFNMNDLRLFAQVNLIKEGMLLSPKSFEYANVLEYFFGRSPNSRELQQPNYIGGFSFDIFIGEVTQTSASTGDSALGNYAGKGTLIDSGKVDGYTFDEIGLMMGLMYIVPQTTYQSSQGINRMWLRNDRFDYYNPAFAHIGLQEIQNQELFVIGDKNVDYKPFGYTGAFNELRYIPDTVTGNMRKLLNIWHFARFYDSLPKLNSDYLQCRPSKRVFTVQRQDTPNITGLINTVITAYRSLPEIAIPELLDHRY